MSRHFRDVRVFAAVALATFASHAAQPAAVDLNGGGDQAGRPVNKHEGVVVQLGPRPFYLVDGMQAGPLKDKLMKCKNRPFKRTDFSIGHRGAALLFPEHTL